MDLVICDFNLSNYCDKNIYNFKKCGTAGYVAPEVINFEEGGEIYNI